MGEFRTYHRFQDADTSRMMVESGRVGGRAKRNIFRSDFPMVKAYVGELPPGRRGIEFITDIAPDGGPPGQAYWSAECEGVEVLEPNELVAIAVTITKVQT